MSLLSRLAVEASRAYGFLTGSTTNVSADYLVVAGGGAGGAVGGGGAGGYRTSTTTLSTLNTYSITVGAGAAGAAGTSGSAGSNSSVSGTGLTTITSTGGGGGSAESVAGSTGGSGGGGGGSAAVRAGLAGTSGQGYAGGNGADNGAGTIFVGGGGGGAGSVGSNASSSSVAGNGGSGTASSISGTSTTYAGGGGGGGYVAGGTATAGTGGSGGGGNGGRNGLNATSGTTNTGGGGGANGLTSAGSLQGVAGSGGSGIVIISYTSATPKFVGGTITTSGGKQIHTFTSSGTLSPLTPITASYLVVAGGGGSSGGNGEPGGGGGAGGLLTSSTTLYSGATYVVTVGAGGPSGTTNTTRGSSGSNSILSGTGLTTITAIGGGYGGFQQTNPGGSGGSGGGGSGWGPSSGGAGTSGQGYAGGSTVADVSPYAAAGGGGAGGVGGSVTSGGNGGAGGIGVASSISGTSTYYAGGGGGSASSGTGTSGAGGLGGGGAGTIGTNGTSGTANTGGGGSGAYLANTGGAGGSGIVIISYAGSQVFNGGLVTSSGGNTIHTFTSTGALTPLTNNLNNSLRFRSSASAYLSRTPTVAGNLQKWTWSGWVKLGAVGTVGYAIFSGGTSTPGTQGGNRIVCWINTSNQLQIDIGGVGGNITTTAVFRDPSAWYHVVFNMDTTQATAGNRSAIYVNGVQQAVTTTVTITQNVSYGVNATQIQTIGTFSNALGGYNWDGYIADVNFVDGQQLEPYYFGNNDANGVWKPIQYKGTFGTNGFYLPFSSVSLFQNILAYSQDFSNAYWSKNAFTASANITTVLAPNGTYTANSILETATTAIHAVVPASSPAASTSIVYTASLYAKSINNQYIQLVFDDTATTNGGYANFDLTNGTVTQSANYGTGTGLVTSITSAGNGWYRIRVSSTIGTSGSAMRFAINGITSGTSGLFQSYAGNASNGYYIWGAQVSQGSTLQDYIPGNFTSATTLIEDTSGNNNYWTNNNIQTTNSALTTYDSMTDVPTNTSATVANYAVLNPLWKASNLTLAGANLNITSTGNGGTAISTMAMESGKWYCEVTVNTGSDATTIGICNNSFNPTTTTITSANAVGYYGNNGDKFVNGTQSAYGASYTTGNIIGIALDVDAGTVTFYKNNTSQGAITHGLTGPFYYATSDASSGSNIDQSWNFGQRPFTYTPPTGYVALNTYNLPTPTILQGNKYMDATLYTGTGTTQNIVNAAGFKPDLVWTKVRNQAYGHALFDSVRGVGNALQSNNTNAEDAWGSSTLASFNSNGFTAGADTSYLVVNSSGNTFVGWQWQAGQGTTSSNTSGSITSTVSVNTTAGFSVVTYTGNGTAGATIGHGLGVAPKMIIVKTRNAIDNWAVYHSSTGATQYLQLNNTNASASSITLWNNTSPTSTVFYVGTNNDVNDSARTYVAYCWAEISGFSKFGSYIGNGSADGPFIYTGFRPKFIMIKSSSTGGVGYNWTLYDTSRNTYNVADLQLNANLSDAEAVSNQMDILSNGFKIFGSGTRHNGSGTTYIYAAFAENPFKNANAR